MNLPRSLPLASLSALSRTHTLVCVARPTAGPCVDTPSLLGVGTIASVCAYALERCMPALRRWAALSLVPHLAVSPPHAKTRMRALSHTQSYLPSCPLSFLCVVLAVAGRNRRVEGAYLCSTLGLLSPKHNDGRGLSPTHKDGRGLFPSCTSHTQTHARLLTRLPYPSAATHHPPSSTRTCMCGLFPSCSYPT